MSVVKELIRTEADGGISFGDYELAAKAKKSDFEHRGDLYKVKTFKEITKLERNGLFVYESVPGTTVLDMKIGNNGMVFSVEGTDNTQITVEMEADCEYKVLLDDVSVGHMKTNLGGKLSFSADLSPDKAVCVEIENCLLYTSPSPRDRG